MGITARMYTRAATGVFLFPPDLQQKFPHIQQKSPKIEKSYIIIIIRKGRQCKAGRELYIK